MQIESRCHYLNTPHTENPGPRVTAKVASNRTPAHRDSGHTLQRRTSNSARHYLNLSRCLSAPANFPLTYLGTARTNHFSTVTPHLRASFLFYFHHLFLLNDGEKWDARPGRCSHFWGLAAKVGSMRRNSSIPKRRKPATHRARPCFFAVASSFHTPPATLLFAPPPPTHAHTLRTPFPNYPHIPLRNTRFFFCLLTRVSV